MRVKIQDILLPNATLHVTTIISSPMLLFLDDAIFVEIANIGKNTRRMPRHFQARHTIFSHFHFPSTRWLMHFIYSKQPVPHTPPRPYGSMSPPLPQYASLTPIFQTASSISTISFKPHFRPIYFTILICKPPIAITGRYKRISSIHAEMRALFRGRDIALRDAISTYLRFDIVEER